MSKSCISSRTSAAADIVGQSELLPMTSPTTGAFAGCVALVGVVELVAGLFREIKRRGVAILLVEQKLAIALDLSERLYVMGHGQIVFEGTPAELKGDALVRREWLEV